MFPVPRLSLRTVFIAAACLVTLFQLTAVTLAALPPNRYSDAVRPQVSYLDPYFTQNWRLFAPNPVAEDREILFQGSYKDADGQVQVTPWLDWTDVELDLVRHRLVGGRAGYITNKMFGSLGTTERRLTDQQQATSQATGEDAPPSWAELQRQLLALRDNPGTVITYLRYDRSTVQLATDVLQARYPGRRLVAVRYALQRQDVVPYSSRHLSKDQREAARPAATKLVRGWRTPSPGGEAERQVVADFYRRHR